MTTTVTHLIAGAAALRYVQHHHRSKKHNKVHAVVAPGLQIRHCNRTTTVCGADIRIEEDETVYTPTYNCWPVTAGEVRPTCKDCRKKLGL